MTFLIVLSLVMIAAPVPLAAGDVLKRSTMLLGLLFTATIVCALWPASPNRFSPDRFTVALVCATGIAAVALYVGTLGWLRKTHPASFMRLGVCVIGMLGGIYLVGATLDHWWFFRGDPDRTGLVDPAAVGASDVPCEFALVRVDENDAQYRCPRGLMFNPLSGRPFVPWPGYQAGRSVALKTGIDRLLKEAVPPGAKKPGRDY